MTVPTTSIAAAAASAAKRHQNNDEQTSVSPEEQRRERVRIRVMVVVLLIPILLLAYGYVDWLNRGSPKSQPPINEVLVFPEGLTPFTCEERSGRYTTTCQWICTNAAGEYQECTPERREPGE